MSHRFSINSIALGNIRRRRGRYLLLIFGIALAIYFVAAALLFADTMFTSLREQHYNRLGEQDAIIFNCGGAPLEELVSAGIFSEYGTAEILGCVLPEGENQVNSFSIARFDDAALALARKDLLAGRLPEKAGEIALERSVLARLRSNSEPGDRITLTLLIPNGDDYMDETVQKNYTLVGILTDKLIYLDQWRYLGGGLCYAMGRAGHPDYPAGVLAADEQIEPGGRAVVNCYGRYAGNAGASFEKLDDFFLGQTAATGESWWLKLEQTHYRAFSGYFGGSDSGIAVISIFFTIIAFVLVCAACLGIINAFSADLESRKRQIGLFRAVGATKKQICSIYGREATLLALCAVPAGLASAALTVWGVTVALGEGYIFRLNIFVLFLVAAAGVLCVRLAAAIPLRRAARIPPMQAIRNADLTRRLKHSRAESRVQFDVPLHMARRHQTLYQNKHAGITAMLALSIVLLSLAVFSLIPLISELNLDYGYDYALRNQGSMRDWLMEYNIHRPGITEQDRADAAALAMVKTVTGEKTFSIRIITDQATPYITEDWSNRFAYLSPEPHRFAGHPDEGQWSRRQHQDYLKAKEKYGYSQDFLTVDCCGAEAELLKGLTPYLSEGRIDLDRLNAGKEIVIIAPAEYGLVHEDLGNGSWGTRVFYTLDEKRAYSVVQKNDMFRAGDEITLSLLYCDNPGGHPEGPQIFNESGDRLLPDDAVRIDRMVTIGAILEPEAEGKRLGNNFSGYFYPEPGDIITTTAGLQALGFDLPYSALAITLSESPDAAMEEYLETNLAGIAARTAGVNLTSVVALARETRQIVYGLVISAGAVLLLLFAICASMINNALSARIRAGKREIGTLRALGASQRVIARSYLWQLLSTFTWGTAAGIALELGLCGWLLWKGIAGGDAFSLQPWPPLLFAALLFGICLLNINSKVGAVCRESITENIREL